MDEPKKCFAGRCYISYTGMVGNVEVSRFDLRAKAVKEDTADLIYQIYVRDRNLPYHRN